jgi:hypothetical protein
MQRGIRSLSSTRQARLLTRVLRKKKERTLKPTKTQLKLS